MKFVFSFILYLFLLFAERRFNRVFKKVKNERVIVITEKSRVNKKIHRIFTNKNRIIKENVKKKQAIIVKKKRVNAEFLKCVFSLFVYIFLFNSIF